MPKELTENRQQWWKQYRKRKTATILRILRGMQGLTVEELAARTLPVLVSPDRKTIELISACLQWAESKGWMWSKETKHLKWDRKRGQLAVRTDQVWYLTPEGVSKADRSKRAS
ncbi:hypothetical protein KOR42_23770 [Thalassoglobus neptunius]|uniref:Uncharacterized protein n=1 Tax=Thalassoglobus neptunius TaxID=1938619 RepID=A0A5C5X7R0_9PLAN|nr:hypothetical protein [Thalassoglobus neptunius]TWT58990.1 hypothetical protein KOR42_23770 [Thalassoglobus neptunius]